MYCVSVVLIDADKTVLNVQDTLVIRCIHKEANFDGWAKDGRSLYTDSEGRVNVSKQVHFITLQVFNLTVNDSGVYSCMSRMPKGNASVEIAVKGKGILNCIHYPLPCCDPLSYSLLT